MKLFTTLAMMALAVTVSAQNLTLSHNGTTLEDGQTVEVYAEATLGGVRYEWNAGISADVKSATAATVKIEASAAPSNITCCAFGNCSDMGASNTELTKSGNLEVGSNDLDIERWFLAAEGDCELTAKITVTAGSETAVANVVFKAPKTEALGSINASQAYVAMNGRTLSYNLPAGKIAIFAITGAKVVEKPVNGQGAISLANLRPGVYLYRAGSTTGKILVK